MFQGRLVVVLCEVRRVVVSSWLPEPSKASKVVEERLEPMI
jgi:hypothetical protein